MHGFLNSFSGFIYSVLSLIYLTSLLLCCPKYFWVRIKKIKNGLEIDNHLGFQKPPILLSFQGMTTELDYLFQRFGRMFIQVDSFDF